MCKTFHLTLLVLSALLPPTLQISLPSDTHYMAGVVEFRPSTLTTPSTRLQDALNEYLAILSSDTAQTLDIIVFPESTLNNIDVPTYVPNPAMRSTALCSDEDRASNVYEDFLIQLSCTAQKLGIYIVINLTEKELCTAVPEDERPCSATGVNVYNTNVVLDRQGVVVSRYRKVHLYGELKNTTLVPEFGWFDTDFGVRFGHFICFDILFYTPAQPMAVKYGIKDFIFPTMWFSQMPFLTGVQIQQSWSYGNDVNLLAAGASNPAIGTTGTGIYNGRKGWLVAKMNQGSGERKLYIARVPKYPNAITRAKRSIPKEISSSRSLLSPDIFLKRDYLWQYDTIILDLHSNLETQQNHKLCYKNGTFCCNFELEYQMPVINDSSTYYTYRLGAYDGLRNENAAEKNQLKNCALFACSGKEIDDCGGLMDINTDVIFDKVTITASFPIVEQYLLMPNTLKAEDLLPVPTDNFQWEELKEKQLHTIRFSLTKSTSNLLAFSVYGNYYDSITNEGPTNNDDDDDGAASLAISGLVVMSVGILSVIYVLQAL